jgi:hypothetical protein
MSEPAAFPFKDGINGTPEGPVFDLVDCEGFDGVFYLKAEHVIEMAHVLGMSTKEETEEMRATISRLEEEAKTLPENVEALIHGLDALVSNWSSRTSPTDNDDSDSDISTNSEVPDESNRQGTTEESGDAGKSDGINSDKSAVGTDSPAVKAKHPSVSKRPDKFSAGPIDGFGFDN